MFSYLRPHHRRTPSTPSSPAIEQTHPFDAPGHTNHGPPTRYHDASARLESPTAASPAPSLPPIARVSSAGSQNEDSRIPLGASTRPEHAWEAMEDRIPSKDPYVFGNHPRSPYADRQRPGSAGNIGMNPGTYMNPPTARTIGSSIGEQQKTTKTFDGGFKFTSANEAQNRQTYAGRRPAGARMPSPPLANTQSTFEPSQPRSGKARLNLLNPMSLLARRRASQQAVQQTSTAATASNKLEKGKFYENFDPRIKGTVVHDFSAPRAPKRRTTKDLESIDTGKDSILLRGPNLDGEDSLASPWSGSNHTPVFTEDFEEEQYPAAGPHVRKASDLTDLSLPRPPYAKGEPKKVEQHGRSKSNEPSRTEIADKFSDNLAAPAPQRQGPAPPIEDTAETRSKVTTDPAATPPPSKSGPSTSVKRRSRGLSELSAKDSIPRHMKSTSSRFSFDMIGAAEQERLLEDRHRRKALEKKSEFEEDDTVDDEYEFDDVDDDGLEERIPGVNADIEDEEELYEESVPETDNDHMQDITLSDEIAAPDAFDGFTFQQVDLGSPLSPIEPHRVSTPRDAGGEVIGFALTKNSSSPQAVNSGPIVSTPPISPAIEVSNVGPELHGLGLHGIEMPQTFRPQDNAEPPTQDQHTDFPVSSTIDEDDLYFDDGIIDPPGDSDETAEFDESVFDNHDTDEYGRPLGPLSSLPTLYSPPNLTADPSPSFNKVMGSISNTKDPSSPISPTIPPGASLAPQPSISEHLNNSNQDRSTTLTQDKLAAYQSALAAAAFAAVASGKFRRDSTLSNGTSEVEDNQPSLIRDSSHTSRDYEPFSPSYELEDDFDYNDAIEDDAIIAAANAEALANDCDGFYGQEFGFYSAPSASEATYANGGYFGPRGVEGLNRSQSGRVASREPNLTPITERSEYSNRNSFMSLNIHGVSPVNNPGLAQLAEMMRTPDYEGDMNLDALLKLRRGAWGSSQASVHSGTGSPRSAGGANGTNGFDDGSPISQIPPWKAGPGQGQGHWRQNSGFSLISDVHSDPGSSAPASPSPAMQGPIMEQGKTLDDRDKEREKEKKGKSRHRYTGSAESISYSKEEDPVNGERWIMERRRTGEGGEVEVLGREVVSGGRI